MPISLEGYVATACLQLGHSSQVLAGTVHLLPGERQNKRQGLEI